MEAKKFGARLSFKDGHIETNWWHGSERGFWSWYDAINQDFHPNLVFKHAVIETSQTDITEGKAIRGTLSV